MRWILGAVGMKLCVSGFGFRTPGSVALKRGAGCRVWDGGVSTPGQAPVADEGVEDLVPEQPVTLLRRCLLTKSHNPRARVCSVRNCTHTW